MVGDTPGDDPDDELYADDAAVSDLDAIITGFETGGEESRPSGFIVSNPTGSVTVSAHDDGRVDHIGLSHRVADMTETELAEEIVVIAGLASQDAKSAQYVTMLEGMREHGHDDHATREFLQRDLDLPTPEQALARRTEVFSTRYAGSHE